MNSIVCNGAKIKIFCPIERKWSTGIITDNNEGMYSVKFSDSNLSNSVIYNLNKYKYCIMKNKDSDLRKKTNNTYEVEAITEKYVDKTGRRLYKIKWKGYSDDESTWEPIEHLQSALKLIQAFEKKLSWKIKNEKELKIFKPVVPKAETYSWLLNLHRVLSSVGTQHILKWIDNQNFEVLDIQAFTSDKMTNTTKLFTAKIYFICLENHGFEQMPVTNNIRLTNHDFIRSNFQFLYNIDLTISHISFYQNRFFKFTRKENSIGYQKQNINLKLFLQFEEIKYWPIFLKQVSLNINKCHVWSEYEVCKWLDCFVWGLRYKEIFYENAIDGRLLLEVTYPVLFHELKIVDPIHQKQLEVAIDVLKRARPILII